MEREEARQKAIRDQVTREWSKVFMAQTYEELEPEHRKFIDRIIATEVGTT